MRTFIRNILTAAILASYSVLLLEAGVAPCFTANSKYAPLDDIPGAGRSSEDSVASCQARCAATPGCAYFSWWNNHGCHLSSTAATQVAGSYGENVQSGPAICSGSAGAAPCFTANSKYAPLDDIPGAGRSSDNSALSCQARCAATSGCAFFSWWNNHGCHLSSAVATQVAPAAGENVQSGPATCSGSAGLTPSPSPSSSASSSIYAPVIIEYTVPLLIATPFDVSELKNGAALQAVNETATLVVAIETSQVVWVDFQEVLFAVPSSKIAHSQGDIAVDAEMMEIPSLVFQIKYGDAETAADGTDSILASMKPYSSKVPEFRGLGSSLFMDAFFSSYKVHAAHDELMPLDMYKFDGRLFFPSNVFVDTGGEVFENFQNHFRTSNFSDGYYNLAFYDPWFCDASLAGASEDTGRVPLSSIEFSFEVTVDAIHNFEESKSSASFQISFILVIFFVAVMLVVYGFCTITNHLAGETNLYL